MWPPAAVGLPGWRGYLAPTMQRCRPGQRGQREGGGGVIWRQLCSGAGRGSVVGGSVCVWGGGGGRGRGSDGDRRGGDVANIR